MQFTVNIHTGKDTLQMKAKEGTNLLQFLRDNSIEISTPCGGKGTCGKCRVLVQGLQGIPSDKERELLGNRALEKGYRLACYNNITSDIDIYIDNEKREAFIVTSGREREINFLPVVSKKYIELTRPDIHDQVSDIERVKYYHNKAGTFDCIDLIRTLPNTLRAADFKVTLVSMGSRLIAVEPGDTTGKLYGIAVDIGTTTIAAYLYDLTSGKRVDVYSMLNPQRKFGDDVLSRIEYTIVSKEAADEMHDAVIECINQIIEHFNKVNKIKKSDIYAVLLVGNTTMVHFLINVTAKNIATSPFIPATTLLHRLNARELGININRYGLAIIYPSVSGYIGADVVAGVLSSGMHDDDKISLFVDIGTNGEIVLGNNQWLYSCSTAAGPAFEGANIRNGVGGIKGAINRVYFNESLQYTTIGNEKAVGICGSGIVDTVAGMLLKGIIDETGRIVGEDKMDSVPETYRSRIIEVDGLKAFLLAGSEESGIDTDIVVTQKDVRELQNAKAAIAAGIKTLVKRAGIKLEDIDRVYLAGGFGSHINVDSALAINLLPGETRGKIESIGNSAGSGASEGLLNINILKESENIKNRLKYVELSASPDFADEYVENMLFEIT